MAGRQRWLRGHRWSPSHTPPPTHSDTATIFVPRVGWLREVPTSRLRPIPFGPPQPPAPVPPSGPPLPPAPVPPVALYQAEIYVGLAAFEHTVVIPADDTDTMTVGRLKALICSRHLGLLSLNSDVHAPSERELEELELVDRTAKKVLTLAEDDRVSDTCPHGTLFLLKAPKSWDQAVWQ